MNNQNINKTKVLFAQGENELARAKSFAAGNDDGKARTSARRAAGFYLEGLLLLNQKDFYGKSFMSFLRGLTVDNDVPVQVKNSAGILVNKPNGLNGEAAISHAEIIIEYCKSEFNKLAGN